MSLDLYDFFQRWPLTFQIKELKLKSVKVIRLFFLSFFFSSGGLIVSSKNVIYAVTPAIMLFYTGHTIEVLKFESIYF